MAADDDRLLPSRSETVRQAIRAALRAATLTAHELSAAVGVREREMVGHLESIERGAKHRGERFVIDAARCEACAFVFKKRERLAAPSRCPSCKSERIHPPRFRIE